MQQFDVAYLYAIASLYYEGGLSQQEIAEREHLSRPQVSRLLARAREIGIVQIHLSLPPGTDAEALSAALARHLNLKQVYIVPDSGKSGRIQPSEAQYLEDFCTRAAPVVAKMIDQSSVVGLGWGRTIYHIASSLPDNVPSREHLFIPLASSNSGISGREYQISAVTFLFGERLHSQTFFLNLSRLSENEANRSPEDVECVQKLHRYWERMDAAVFTVGPAENTISSIGDDDRIAGDILLQNYLTDGTAFRNERAADMIAIDVHKLKHVPRSILVAVSKSKVRAIFYAIKSGFCNVLVTDTETALALLQYHDGQ